MLVPCVVPFWLLALYVLLASAAFSDHNGLLCARQHPVQLRIHGHRNRQQQMSLQTAIKSVSPKSLLTATFTFPSFKHTDIRTLAQDSTHTNSTQLGYGSDDSWARDSRPFPSQGESLNDGLISRVQDMSLAKDTDDSDETSIEQQHNDATNVPDDGECPTGVDTLDCEDCGGPEQTWEARRNDYHCKGIEAEGYKWKDCYCINWENDRGPCRLGHDWGDNYFPFENLPNLPSPSGDSSDHEDLADDPGDSNNEPTDGQDALESGPEGSATATEEEEPRTERDQIL